MKSSSEIKKQKEFIRDEKVRKTTFMSRKSTLKKKAEELATLCDVKVGLICVESDGKMDTWPENRTEVKEICESYKNEKLKMGDEHGFLHSKKPKLEDNRKFEMNPIEKWEESLMGLWNLLELKIQTVNNRMNMMVEMEKSKGTQKQVNGGIYPSVESVNGGIYPSLESVNFQDLCDFGSYPDEGIENLITGNGGIEKLFDFPMPEETELPEMGKELGFGYYPDAGVSGNSGNETVMCFLTAGNEETELPETGKELGFGYYPDAGESGNSSNETVMCSLTAGNEETELPEMEIGNPVKEGDGGLENVLGFLSAEEFKIWADRTASPAMWNEIPATEGGGFDYYTETFCCRGMH